MALPVTRVHYPGQIHSPFSGEPADGDDGPNEQDPSLLFVYYGMAGDYAYVSPRLQDGEFGNPEVDEDTPPTLLAEKLDIPDCFVLEVDTDWNGVNYYCFAPSPAEA